MAERIDPTLATSYINHVTYGGPTHFWQRGEWTRLPDYARNAWNHPFANRIREQFPDILRGMIVGGVVRYSSRMALAGLGGLWIPVGAGVFAGAAVEWSRQVNVNIQTAPLTATGFRGRFREILINPDIYLMPNGLGGVGRIGFAALKGGVGGFIGAEIANVIPNPFQGSEGISAPRPKVPPGVPGFKEVGTPTPTQTPLPTREGIATFTPKALTTEVVGPTSIPAPRPSVTIEPTRTSLPTVRPTDIPGRVPGALPTPTLAPEPTGPLNLEVDQLVKVDQLGVIGGSSKFGAHFAISYHPDVAFSAPEGALHLALASDNPSMIFEEARRSGLSVDEAIKAIRETKAFQDYAGSETYKQLHLTEKAVSELLARRNIDPSGISSTMMETLKKAAQKRLEDDSYAIFNRAFEETFSQPGISYEHALMVASGRFAAEVNSQTELDSMVRYAQNELVTQSAKTAKIMAELKNTVDILKPRVVEIEYGSSYGVEMQKVGVVPYWDGPRGADWKAAEIAVNYGGQKDYFTSLIHLESYQVLSYDNFYPSNPHIPVNLSELDELRRRALDGDRAANKILNDMLYRVRSGQSVQILNKAQIETVKRVLESASK